MISDRVKNGFAVILALAGLGTVGYAAFVAHAEKAAKDAATKTGGFESYEQLERARAAGIKTGDEWRSKVAADAAKTAAEEAQRKREWDAAAPERAAAAAKKAKADAEAAAREAEARRPVRERMNISGQSWTTGGFDTVGMMTFTIENDNDYMVKDITISCSFRGNSGTFLGDRTHTVYETVKPRSKRKFSKVNIGFIPNQSARGGCIIETAQRA